MSNETIAIGRDDRFLKLREVMKLTALSRSHVYHLAQNARFPNPYKLSEKSSAWLHSEVLAWMDARISDSRGNETQEVS